MIIFPAGPLSDSVGAEGLWNAAHDKADQALVEQPDPASLIAGATAAAPDSVEEFVE